MFSKFASPNLAEPRLRGPWSHWSPPESPNAAQAVESTVGKARHLG